MPKFSHGQETKFTNDPNEIQEIQDDVNFEMINETISLNYLEMNCLYYLSGYVVTKIITRQKTCDICISKIGSRDPIDEEYANLTGSKCYTDETLFFVNAITFEFILSLEKIFRYYFEYLTTMNNVNFFNCYFSKMNMLELDVPNCHDIKTKIINKFIFCRLKTMSQNSMRSNVNTENLYASKSMAMHLSFQ